MSDILTFKISKKEFRRSISFLAILISNFIVSFAIIVSGVGASTTVIEIMISIIAGASFLIFGVLFLILYEIIYLREDIEEKKVNVRKK